MFRNISFIKNIKKVKRHNLSNPTLLISNKNLNPVVLGDIPEREFKTKVGRKFQLKIKNRRVTILLTFRVSTLPIWIQGPSY